MSITNPVTTNTSAPAATASTTTPAVTIPGGALNENSFLQLLTTQMQYQDPLQPQDNSQFIAQLAQFTSLEQMTNVATNDSQIATKLTALQGTIDQSSAYGLLGKSVTVTQSNGTTVTGAVTSVTEQSGQPAVQISGTYYPMTDVTSVSSSGSTG